MAGDPAAALASLDRAIEAGDASEKTLARKALALRRLRQSEQAEALYRRIHEEFPDSGTGVVGMVQSLSKPLGLLHYLTCHKAQLYRSDPRLVLLCPPPV
jgi:tetratricopeptide (TPR) repeat protein